MAPARAIATRYPTLAPALPLSKIMVGPTNHPYECCFAVGDLLVKCGYGQTVPVENSRNDYSDIQNSKARIERAAL